ncbi:MAG: hypothetical protein LBH60_01205, partial [Prevotellaceae bacterium]|nr:hypothetical protein [Prevotellaceae bacterium]
RRVPCRIFKTTCWLTDRDRDADKATTLSVIAIHSLRARHCGHVIAGLTRNLNLNRNPQHIAGLSILITVP